jgi:hypothetical protein
MSSTIPGIELAYAIVVEYVPCVSNVCKIKIKSESEEMP